MKNIIFLLSFLTIFTFKCQNKGNDIPNKSENRNYFNNSASKQNSELRCENVIFNSPTKNLWNHFKIKEKKFIEINSEKHYYFIENCNSISISPDKRVYLFREVLQDDNFKDDYNYYEAPYVGFDSKTQKYVSYIGIIDKKLQFLSLSTAKADFVNFHDFNFENETYYLSDDLLKIMPSLVKKNQLILKLDDIKEILKFEPINDINVNDYNNVGYFMLEKKHYNESIFLINYILKKYPNRVVAWLNLGDAYWSLNEKNNAKNAYDNYISLMKSQNKNISKIPQRVYERIK